MSTIVTRAGKGTALSWTEMDANFTNLNTDKYQAGNNVTFATATVTTINASTYVGLPVFAGSTAGIVPTSVGGTANYLRADGSWAAPPGSTSGTVTSVGITSTVLSVSGSPITTSGNITLGVNNGVITNAMLANMADQTFKGNTSGGAAAPSDLTATQATAMLNSFTSLLKGLAPASGGGTTNFLRADGTWTAPSVGGVAWGAITGTLSSQTDLQTALNTKYQSGDSPTFTTAAITTANVTTANITTAAITTLSVAGNNISADHGFIRNRIINGAMRIDQRNAGSATSINSSAWTYTLDRWAGYGQAADGVFSVQQLSTGTPAAGFTHYLRVKTTTADASVGSGQRYLIKQAIEGNNIADLDFGLSTAKAVTLSFWVRCSLTGTFGGALQNSAADRSYPFQYTISSANTWERKTITVAGDTTGTWLTDTGIGMNVILDVGTGSTWAGTVNTWAAAGYYSATGSAQLINTINATLDFTGAQLEVGSVRTEFEIEIYSQTLTKCQRYYEVSTSGNYWSGNVTSFVQYYYGGNYKVTKRIAPTATATSIANNGFPSTAATITTSTEDWVATLPGSNATVSGGVYAFVWVATAEL